MQSRLITPYYLLNLRTYRAFTRQYSIKMTDWSSERKPPAPESMSELVKCMREDYKSDVLLESNVDQDPFVQFEKWLKRAKDNNFFEPHGMMLCTSTPDGQPSARIVLLRQFDHRGFVFYTNYNSRKAQQIASNPNVAATFWWHESSVRIEGKAEKVTSEESDAYFGSRPRNSQLGAWASAQSTVLDSRLTLEDEVLRVADRFPDLVPRPEWWEAFDLGRFRIVPHTIEFWQGRPSRLHDRIRFSRDLPSSSPSDPSTSSSTSSSASTCDPSTPTASPWKIVRLAP